MTARRQRMGTHRGIRRRAFRPRRAATAAELTAHTHPSFRLRVASQPTDEERARAERQARRRDAYLRWW